MDNSEKTTLGKEGSGDAGKLAALSPFELKDELIKDDDPNQVDYYTILDVEFLGERAHGREFVDWLLENTKPSELLFRLAREAQGVLLPGRGFGTKHPFGRVSLANLNESDYRKIRRAVRTLLAEYVDRYNVATGKKLDRNKVS
jgi:aspartate 4-decarboxylase